ncbi:MAG: ABC transporter ATP-binding protein [Candidatus Sumerlaeaceae bacterium]
MMNLARQASATQHRGAGIPSDDHVSEEWAVAAQAVEFAYGQRRIFSNFSLSLPAGKLCGLLGPNGSGKSTLLRLVATLDFPQGGTIRVLGLDTRHHTRDVRRCLGVVFQSPSLDKRLTVRENLSYHGLLYGLRGRELAKRIEHALAVCEITDRADEFVRTLSGGLQRRVEIAKALLPGPRVLVLDEPTTGLDVTSRHKLLEYIRRLCEAERLSVLLTTHLLDEGELCDEVVILDRGQTVAQGRPAELIAQVGGHVLWVTSSDPALITERVRTTWGLTPQLIKGRLRIELPKAMNGHSSRFIVELVEKNRGLVSTVMLAQPTLEDVFIHATGRACDVEQADSEDAP